VTDFTGTLHDSERRSLERKLAEFEKRKGSQIAVLIIPTTEPESIEQYAIRVAEAWRLGRKGVDDGVLLLVAKNDRRLRIEVGRGLEGAIPDLAAKRIVTQFITPQFKQGNYGEGLAAGTDWIIRLIDGETLPAPKPKSAPGASELEDIWPVAIVVAIILGAILRTMFGRVMGAGIAGGLSGAVFWFFVQILWISALVGIAVFVLTLFLGLGGGRRGGGGGWYSGGPGGGWGSSGSGDGGFSGGGGDFGGGGASGDW
jgi:uncharacterized protein